MKRDGRNLQLDQISQEEIMRLHQLNSPKNNGQNIPNYEQTKCSYKQNGIVQAYAANTNQGLVRKYNEDRVSIILNISKPSKKQLDKNEQWPQCSYFAIFDGHGGQACADYLRDNLHNNIIENESFPKDITTAIINGCQKTEEQFLIEAESKNPIEKSGSCAIIALIVDNMVYTANVGDSRAILSRNKGTIFHDLSNDHKPSLESEHKRIIQNGGKVYYSVVKNQQGPRRVFPGRLSVSRAFGDIEAKKEKYGGKEGVVIAVPEIKVININHDKDDFIILGCDGIFDYLNTQQVIAEAWNFNINQQNSHLFTNLHQLIGDIVERIIIKAFSSKSMDNLTTLVIAFPHFLQNIQDQLQNFYKSKENNQPKTKNNQVFNFNHIPQTHKNQKELQLFTDFSNQQQKLNVQSTKNQYSNKIVFKRIDNNINNNDQQLFQEESKNKFKYILDKYNQINQNKQHNKKESESSRQLKENLNKIQSKENCFQSQFDDNKSNNENKQTLTQNFSKTKQLRINKNQDIVKSLNNFDLQKVKNKNQNNEEDLKNNLLNYNFNTNVYQQNNQQKLKRIA